jgi:hypothetical protein
MAEKLPIPEVVDLNFKTYVICWPNSDKWEGILTGMISMPASTSFWDETTGNLDDILTVGFDILAKNARIAEREVNGMTCLIPVGAEPILISVDFLGPDFGNEVQSYGPAAGETWLVTQTTIVVTNFSPTFVRISVVANGNEQWLKEVNSPENSIPVTHEGSVVLDDQSLIRFRANGLGVETRLRFGVFGWRWTV